MTMDEDDKNLKNVKETNIKVCVRIRPLLVDPSKNQKFFSLNRSPRNKTTTSSLASLSVSSTSSPSPSASSSPRNVNTNTSISRPFGFPMPQRALKKFNVASKLRTPSPRHTKKPNGSSSSLGSPSVVSAWQIVDQDTVQQSTQTVKGRTNSYTMDRIYGPQESTFDLYYESVQSIVMSAVQDGFHASVFCYGQTSTGKTYTMSGTHEAPGICPLAIQDVFDFISQSSDAREYLVRVTYLEIYNEQIYDLLQEVPNSGSSSLHSTMPSASPVVRVMEGKDGVMVVRGCREQVVTCPQDVYDCLARGESKRRVGATNMNKHSSRSHTIVRLWFENRPLSATSDEFAHFEANGGETPCATTTTVSSLCLVDLAGSESVRLSGSTGERRREGQYINKSLTALGQVVYKLSEDSNPSNNKSSKIHIPYRDSKLTRLLQPSLSGNAQVVVICNISSSASHLEESHNTLKFATRAKKIQQRVIRNEVEHQSTLLQSYREEIFELRQQLRESQAMAATAAPLQQQPHLQDEDDVRELVAAIAKIEGLILKTRALRQDITTDTPRSSNANAPRRQQRFQKQGMKNRMSSSSVASTLLLLQDSDDDDDDLSLVTRVGPTLTPVNPPPIPPPSKNESKQTSNDLLVTPAAPEEHVETEDEDDEEEFSRFASNKSDDDLISEMHRIQGMLQSVLERRGAVGGSGGGGKVAASIATACTVHSSSSSSSSPSASPSRQRKDEQQQQQQAACLEEEVQMLKVQLEEQRVTTNLSKADSNFLQSQLEQKDSLLQEASNILTVVEQRQGELEKENSQLRFTLLKKDRQIARLQQEVLLFQSQGQEDLLK